MEIELVTLDKIIPYARNPRKNALAVANVASSIKEFGWRQPIVVDSEMVGVAGHTRLEAAHCLGVDKVPVHVARNLSVEQIKAYRLADNRTGQDAEWDHELLSLELTDLSDADFNLDFTGFTDNELTDLLNYKPSINELYPDGEKGSLQGLLAESHMAVHTYPEKNFIALDIFTCGNEGEPYSVVDYFREKLDVVSYSINIIPRGRTL